MRCRLVLVTRIMDAWEFLQTIVRMNIETTKYLCKLDRIQKRIKIKNYEKIIKIIKIKKEYIKRDECSCVS